MATTSIDTAPVATRRASAYRWYVVAVLALAYCLSAIDARVLTLLVIPIQRDLGLGDFELGLLQGFAFALLYSVAAIPLGRLVDSSSARTRIILCGVAVWSAMTIACGLARSFGQLFTARIGVGVGEAALSPTAYSLISDYFEPRRRALAISCYAIGYPIGGGLALIIGGFLLDRFTKAGGAILPFVGALEPWQAVFVVVGLPGLLVAALLLTIREPERRETGAAGETAAMPLRAAAAYLLGRWPLYAVLVSVISLLGMLSIGVTLWYPTFLIRTYHMPVAQVGLLYGAVMLACGTIGTLGGGWLSGRLMQKGRADANLRIVLATTLLKAIPLIVGPLMPNAALALGCMAFATLVGQAAQGVMIAAIQDVTPNRLRGQVMALTLFCVNLVGLGLGASVIAAVTDFVFRDPAALRYSIVLVGVVLLPAITIILLVGLPIYRRALIRPA